MNKKNILVILVIVLSLSFVSANNLNETNTSDNDFVNDVTNTSKQELSNVITINLDDIVVGLGVNESINDLNVTANITTNVTVNESDIYLLNDLNKTDLQQEPSIVVKEKESFQIWVNSKKFLENNFLPVVILGIAVIIVLGAVYYYRNYTIAGLSKRYEKLHEKADKYNEEARFKESLRARRKARYLQKKAEERGY